MTQVKIREELTRNGPELRYSLDGNEFSTVDPVPLLGTFPTELTCILQATFVGSILDVVVSSETTQTFRIVDGTGKITSTLMIKKGQEAEHQPSWR